MKQKLFIFLFLILLTIILVGLNAVSYVQKEKTPDSEVMPNRSTFNSGATGTQALYALLSETGRKVMRWQEPPAGLLTDKKAPVAFVVIGAVKREYTDAETEQLLQWVSNGGRLVLIDRGPPKGLATSTASWKISFDNPNQYEILTADPSDQKQMIGDAVAVKPVQPTVFVRSANAVQPSRFASSISFERFAGNEKPNKQENGTGSGQAAPPPRAKPLSVPVDKTESPSHAAPVVHFAAGERNLLVDVPYGNGKIVFLSDPYIVSNGGIGLVDNAQLAINILSAGDGVIAFDEYHQGYGTNNNRFLQFFEGTPVVAIFLQGSILIGFIFFSQSRRFARPVPEREPDRLSKLEYVLAMAELQQRTKAFDLAVENIYTDFRRRVARFLGVDNYTSTRNDIANLIAERTRFERRDIDETMFKCEDIVRGEPTNKTEVLRLSRALRELEEKLGMTRSGKVKI